MKLCLLLLCLLTFFSADAMQSSLDRQETTYEFTLTVRNINGQPRSAALVKLYSADALLPVNELTANALGEVVFSGLLDGTYRYEVFYKSSSPGPVEDATEYWGSGEVTINGNSPSLVFTRNQPYISREAVFVPSVLQASQTSSGSFTVKNNQLLPVETYIALWIDRDKSAPWDFTKEHSSRTTHAASISVFSFALSPVFAGSYYCYAFVYSKINGKFIITDQYTWYEVFKVSDVLGDLKVYLPDYKNTNSTLGDYKISRYDLSYQLLDSRVTDSQGMAIWTGIMEGNYLLERYQTSLNGLWGNDLYQGARQVNITPGNTETVAFDRTEPFIESVAVNGTVFGTGSPVHAEVRVTNPSAIAKTCQATIRIDPDQQLPFDFESGFQDSRLIPPGQTIVFGFDWTIPNGSAPGTYSVAASIQTLYANSWRYTDATNWNPLINNENNTISQIQWSGLTWNVKSGTGLGPGPNDWLANSSSVWVDGENNLHLKIRKMGTKWYCASISTKPLSGYGEYTFQVSSDVETMDKNVVLGLFTYETDTREIDIEFSRWGDALEQAGWYNVQPSGPDSHHSFDLNLKDQYSTHKYQWSPSKIFFQSYRGHFDYLPEKDKLISEWTYTGSQIPPAGNERVILNLWLFRGVPPSDMKETEVVIKSFSFSKVGDLTVNIRNLDQTSSPAPGANAMVQLYDLENKLISTKQTDQLGNVSFNGLRVGSGYYYRVYYQPNNLASPAEKEYWGTQSGIQITDRQTTRSIFTREQPISGTIKAYMGTKEVTTQTIEPGVPLRIEQTIINPSSAERQAKGMVRVDRDSIEPLDFCLMDTSLISIPAKSTVTRQWTIIPVKKGSYYSTGAVQTILDKDTLATDIHSWTRQPLFTINSPGARFSMNKTNGCNPLKVEFTDQSTFFPSAWAWDFDNDGMIDDTTQNPVYTYNEPGTYSVKLTVANPAGTDSMIHTENIVVNPTLLPEIKINVSPSEKADAGTLVTFNAISTNGGTSPTYEWQVDGKTTGMNNSIFSTNELTNGQKVSCRMTSNAPCAFPITVNSNVIAMEIKPVNKIPIAHAGIDQTIEEETLVSLDGTASYDLDNQPLGFLWTAPDGITLSSVTASRPVFTAPEVKNDTTLIFSLTVNDGIINSPESFVKIYVKAKIPVNNIPIANAGIDQTIEEGTLVYLDGTASYDWDNQPLGYLWTAPDGITLSSVTASRPAFTAPDIKNDTTLTFFLTVNDGITNSPESFVKIYVIAKIPVNKMPVAHAGVDQTVEERTLITLDGTASIDLDNQPLTYRWFAPENINLSSRAVSQPTFTAPEVKNDTTLYFFLTVNDGIINSFVSSVKIRVINVIYSVINAVEYKGLKIYPNPTKGIFLIQGLNEDLPTEISIYSSEGKQVNKIISHSSSCTVDLSRQMPGTYVLVIDKQTIKIIRE